MFLFVRGTFLMVVTRNEVIEVKLKDERDRKERISLFLKPEESPRALAFELSPKGLGIPFLFPPTLHPTLSLSLFLYTIENILSSRYVRNVVYTDTVYPSGGSRCVHRVLRYYRNINILCMVYRNMTALIISAYIRHGYFILIALRLHQNCHYVPLAKMANPLPHRIITRENIKCS